ncbi:MAG: HAMP domain-containing histidine kinase [Candidatus Moranbacteria bacterium]|nr:HAMP domain-containing histidine kinase [Candidatus Moranbacteria bacterium]
MICPSFPDPQFFFFVDDASPLLYYSHIPAVIISLFLGIFVYIKGGKTLLNTLLLTLIFVFSLWTLFDLITWTSNDSTIIFFVWSLFGLLYALIALLSVYFVSVFIEGKDISFRKKLVLGILFTPIIFFTPTSCNIETFDLASCGISDLSFFLYYYYFLGGLSFFWILGIFFVHIARKNMKQEIKKQFLFLIVGIELFLLFFFGSGLLASFLVSRGYAEGYNFIHYGLFGMPIFIAFLTYIIVTYNAMNIKLLGVNVLIFAISILIASQFLFVRNPINKVLTAITLVLVLIFGFILIRSMERDLQRKEELQVLADQLAIANQKLKSLDRAKSEFISIASHQLRTPLTAIKGFISLILEGSYGDIDGSIRSALNKVYLSNERLIRLVEDLLSISRIESGRLEYKFRRWKLEDLVEDVADMFRLRARDAGLDFQVIAPREPIAEVYIDGDKIREVISNLIDNAIKYTKKGFVQVSVSQRDAEYVHVIIKDSGVGVLAEDIPHLFEKFSRGKDTDQLHANGTGLGLYVGKQIVEAHGGKIHIFSGGENKGSTFILELSLRRGDEKERKDALPKKEE